jgi:hypothetical protein
VQEDQAHVERMMLVQSGQKGPRHEEGLHCRCCHYSSVAVAAITAIAIVAVTIVVVVAAAATTTVIA